MQNHDEVKAMKTLFMVLGIVTPVTAFIVFAGDPCYALLYQDCVKIGRECRIMTESGWAVGVITSAEKTKVCVAASPGRRECKPKTQNGEEVKESCKYECMVPLGGANVKHTLETTVPAYELSGDSC